MAKTPKPNGLKVKTLRSGAIHIQANFDGEFDQKVAITASVSSPDRDGMKEVRMSCPHLGAVLPEDAINLT